VIDTRLADGGGASAGDLSQRGLGRLAAWCYDHRRRVLTIWALAVIVVVGLAQAAGSRLDNNFSLPGSRSQQAQSVLASRFPAEADDSADVVLRSSAPLDSAASDLSVG
jgi:putative drug exporter of the RND superfamily